MIALALLAPAAMAPYSWRVFEPLKAVLLWMLAAGIALAALRQVLAAPRHSNAALRHSTRSLWLPAAACALALAIATLLSVDPASSLLGSAERRFGSLTQLSLLVLLLAIAANLRGPAARRRLTSALIGSSVPVVLYAGAQAARLDPFFWRPELQERAASTIGNPIQLGAFCAVVFFPTLARAWALESKRSARAAYAVLLALQVAALFWTRSRGAAVAFAVGAIAFGIAIARQRTAIGGLGPRCAAALVAVAAGFTVALLVETGARSTDRGDADATAPGSDRARSGPSRLEPRRELG